MAIVTPLLGSKRCFSGVLGPQSLGQLSNSYHLAKRDCLIRSVEVPGGPRMARIKITWNAASRRERWLLCNFLDRPEICALCCVGKCVLAGFSPKLRVGEEAR